MEKRGGGLIVAALLIAILVAETASANFVCGKVAPSEDGVSPSWFDVIVYYTDFPDEVTTCKISPADNKYCCDPLQIKSVSWKIGRNISAEIFDLEKGYVAGPVSLIISGEGYDVFPEMQLEKALKIHSPDSGIYINESSVLLNVSVASRFNEIRYSLKKIDDSGNFSLDNELICSNCTEGIATLENLDFGKYSLEVFAINTNSENISERKNFSLLEYVELEREINCDALYSKKKDLCEKGFVFSGQKVNITLILKMSHEASGVLEEYFPSDWIYDGSQDGVVEDFSDSHRVIKWNVDGKEVKKSYSLTAPETFFAKKYYFQSRFESFLSEKEKIVVFRFYRIFPFPKKFLDKEMFKLYEVFYESASREHPVVMNIAGNDSSIVEIAIFPATPVKKVHAFFHRNSKVKLKKAEKPFAIVSSIPDSKIDKILIRYRVKKTGGSEKDYLNSTLFHYEINSYVQKKGKWVALQTKKYSEDNIYIYYEAYSDKKGLFAIKNEFSDDSEKRKEGIFEKLKKLFKRK